MSELVACGRCEGSFRTDSDHFELIYQRHGTDEQPTAIKLCPDCADTFEEFLT